MKNLLLTILITSLAACGGGGSASDEPKPTPTSVPTPTPTPTPKNIAPVISDVIITDENEGDVLVGDTIILNYQYSDTEHDIEGDSRIRWLRDEVEISGASSCRYTLTPEDAGRAIKTEVTPVASSGTNQGELVFSNTIISQPLMSAELSFAHSEAKKLIIGSEFANAATRKGAGVVTYSSSDDSIITVDSNGALTVKKVGSVSITAMVEADGNYKSESINYDVDVMYAEINIKGWSGKHGSSIDLDVGLPGVTMLTTTDTHCSLNITDECADYTILEFDEFFRGFYLSNATIDSSEYIQFNYGDYRASLQVSPSEFTTTTGMQIVTFKGRLWAFGGREFNGGTNEVWSSVDGRSWEQMETDINRLFSPRTSHQVREFNGKLWMTGGEHYAQERQIYYSDVWSSDNGIHWSLETDNAAFDVRSDHQMTVANGKLWLTGNSAKRSDLSYWSSADGVNWENEGDLPLGGYGSGIELETIHDTQTQLDRLILNVLGSVYISDDKGEFSHRSSLLISAGSGSRMVNSNNNLWLIDAFGQRVYKLHENKNESGYKYYHFAAVEMEVPFPAHDSSHLVDFKNRLWLVAGRNHDGNPLGTQSFSSTNGMQWKKETDDAEFAERTNTIATTLNGDLILAGGHISGHYNSNIFRSKNGIQWDKIESTGQPISTENALYKADIEEFKNKLWLVNKDGLHVSSNGEFWAAVETNNFPVFGTIPESKLVVHKEKLWLISVDGHERKYRKRVYSSADGVNWDVVTTRASFTAVSKFKVVSFKDRIWVVQGVDDLGRPVNRSYSSYAGDVWGGSVDYTPVLNNAIGSDVAVFKGQMWSIGGANRLGGASNSVFVSLDGADWDLARNSSLFSPRHSHSLLATEERLYVISGATGSSPHGNEVWSTEDGYTWVRAFQNKVEFTLAPINNP